VGFKGLTYKCRKGRGG